MLLDQQNLLSDAQDLAKAVGSYLSTNSIDLGASTTDVLGNTIPSDPGKSRDLYLLAQVVEDFTSGGAGTLQVNLVTGSAVDANGQISAGKTVLRSTPAIPLVTLVSGYQFRVGGQLPPGITQRYLALEYVIGTAAMTAGAVTGALVSSLETNYAV